MTLFKNLVVVVFLAAVLVAVDATITVQKEKNKQDPRLDQKLKELEKYCPYFGFDGVLQCPSGRDVKPAANPNSQIISGVGYDRILRQVRFPVFPSTSPSAAASNSYQTYKFNQVADYLNMVFSQKDSYAGGLFIFQDDWVTKFASLFSDYQINMAVTQKQFVSYSTGIESQNLLPEFTDLLYSVPATYDPNNETLVHLYRTRIIEVFGTEVTTSTNHGGIFYQQSAVKSCYGGSITDDMIHEIDSSITKQPPGPLAWLKYRSVGLFDVKGGNPELPHDQIDQIIASFSSNPAIISFNAVPLWQVVPDNYKDAVRAAIEHYTGEKQSQNANLIAEVERQKLQNFKNPQNVFVYGRQTEQLFPTIIRWDQCPYVKAGGNLYTPRCTILVQQAQLAAGQTSTFVDGDFQHQGRLHYESQREGDGGNMRMYAWFHHYFGENAATKKDSVSDAPYKIENVHELRDVVMNVTASVRSDSNDIQTDWIRTGCSDLGYIYITGYPDHKVYFTACMDCQPVVTTSGAGYGLVHSDLQCVCPGF